MKPQSRTSEAKRQAPDPLKHAANRFKAAAPALYAERVAHDTKKYGLPIPKDKRPAVTLEFRVALATHLATIGPIHPLIPETKRPATKNGVLDATQDPKIIRDWCVRYPNCNWGITANVVDVDSAVKPGNTQSGADTWNPIVIEHGEPDTYKITTPSGGEHYYILEELPNKANALGEGIDARCAGKGYVVAAGSHVTQNAAERVAVTGFYTAVNQKPIRSVPWITTLEAYTPAAPDRGDEVENPEPLIDCELLAECLAALDPANFRDQEKWFRLMCSCHHATAGQGYPEWSDWSLSDTGYTGDTSNIENRWNSLHTHEGGDLQMDSEGGLIESLKAVGRNDLIFKIDGDAGTEEFTDDAKPANDNEEVDSNVRPHIYPSGYSADQLADTDFPKQEEIIEGMMYEGKPQTIDGDGGVGKSTTAAQAAVHRCVGKPMFGRKVKQGPAIFITHEDDYDVVKARMENTARFLGLPEVRGSRLRGLPLHVICNLEDDLCIAIIDDNGKWKQGPFYATLDALMATMPGALVFMDCLEDFKEGDFVTKRAVPNAFYKQVLAQLAKKHGRATPVMLCHPSKASMSDGSWSEGTTANRTAVRGKLVMKLVTKGDDDGPRYFGILKRQYGENGGMVKVAFNQEFGIFTLDTEPNLTAETVALYERVIVKVLELIDRNIVVCKYNQSSGQGPNAIAAAMGETEDDGIEPTNKEVVAALEWAERKGKIKHVAGDKNRRVKEHYERPEPSDSMPA